jgi:ABC-type sugar transport system ATPase subunit
MTTPVQPLMALRSVSKRYMSTQALKDLSFELLPGEVHAIVGENGAGKSTALGLMYGVVQPDEGELSLAGQAAVLANPAIAQSLGVACVFQELSLAGGLSIAENIYAGRPPSYFGIVDWARMRQAARSLLAEFDVFIDVNRPVERLPISTRQIVEIAKALSLDAKILLLDEPTSALTHEEVRTLFAILRKITKRGIGVVYVSHLMSEVFEIADRITVLRDGRHISTRETAATTANRVVAEMVGSEIEIASDERTQKRGAIALQARGLSRRGQFEAVDLTLRNGEITGLAGLMGAHRSEIARSLAGLDRPDSGALTVAGRDVAFRAIEDALKERIVYVPNDRKIEGLFLEMAVADNVVAATLDRHQRLGVMDKASMAAATSHAVDRFAIRTASQDLKAGFLSGGNQQKLMLAKYLEINPAILIVDEPTKGVDIGAKHQIHAELRHRRNEGMAILLISSDWLELLTLADRILVVRDGRITAEVMPDNSSEDDLLSLASGLSPSTAKEAPAAGAEGS